MSSTDHVATAIVFGYDFGEYSIGGGYQSEGY